MSRTIRLALAGVTAIAVHFPLVSVAQEAFQSFAETDFFYSQDPQLFRNLWQAAQSRTVRIVVLGDSQEANPPSLGYQYVPRLNYEMWKRFGNSPETPVEGCYQYGLNSTPADWLTAGRCTPPGPVDSRLGPARILPGVRAAAFSSINGATNVTGGHRGQLTMLQQDAVGVDPSAQVPTGVSYF